MKQVYFYDTPIGRIGIGEKGSQIRDIFFDEEEVPKEYIRKESHIIRRTIIQLKEYFAGERKIFDIPLYIDTGTEFQKKVWNELLNIPYGETRTYKEIAEAIGHPKAYRAVGMANNKNPIPIIIPCHRVIGSNGKLIGYGGGIHIKEKLLDLEKRYKRD